MRRRLLASTLGIALVCVAVLGVPLVLLARHQVWTSARDRVREQAASVATGLEDRLDVGQPVQLEHFLSLMPQRRIIVHPAHGPTVAAGTTPAGPVLQATVHVSDSRVTVQAAQAPVVTRAREVTLVVIGLAVLATAAAVTLALWQARRVARPIAELVGRADALGRGAFAGTALASGVPEIDHVSEVLERSARQVGNLVELQREFASDAAHQLRTPLTSIGLHLDEISTLGCEDVRIEADEALAQVERLNAVISSLLARARGDSADPTVVDLRELIQDGTPPWARVLERDGRQLIVDGDRNVRVLARRAHVLSVMSSLLDNAVMHGSGTVTIAVRRSQDVANIIVRDEGPGVPPELAPHIFDRQVSGNRGTGIGLALAHALAAAESGTLRLSEQSPAEFVFSLPVARNAGPTAEHYT